MKRLTGVRSLMAIGVVVLAACSGDSGGGDTSADAGVVNVYSHRHYDTDQELFRRFTELTGIQVNVQTASADELITRLETEGADTEADLLVTVDAGRLERAKVRGLLRAVSSETLEANVPANLRDPEGYWYGLTQRGRVIVYAKDRVSPEDLSTYEDLADPKWRGKILVRSSENIYNQSLLASIIAVHGDDEAERWAEGVVQNMARTPQGSDRDQVRDVAAGVGDLAIVNTYYLGLLFNGEDERDRALVDKVGVFFPNQNDRGAHMNVSGAGVTAYSPNPDNALRLLEFLTDTEAQTSYAEANYEYPVKPGIAWAETLTEWGEFRPDTLNLSVLGELNTRAVMVFDRAGWR
ncbi:MAG: Fe(3+) ABC transporter substrate-binding protein [Gemmatimonadetes bacterium]|nr:Fe(3+) ABC transporter substrate-binding protein [Gemmatimonadota bacterium]MCH8812469.1 Fe(3+) ABC transporter substrate-binding protein [Gemmatimonadota bacterium]